MRVKAWLVWTLLASAVFYASTAALGQILFRDFRVLSCQGGATQTFGDPNATVDGSGNLIIHTSQPSFAVVVTTLSSSATGLIGETCTGAAFPNESLSQISGVQELWKFDGDLTDAAGGGRNLSWNCINGSSGGGCGGSPTFVNDLNGSAGVGLGQAWQLGTSATGNHEYGTQPGAGANIDFSVMSAFTVEAWVAATAADACTGGTPCSPSSWNAPSPACNSGTTVLVNRNCSGAPGSAGTCSGGGGCNTTRWQCAADADCSGDPCGGDWTCTNPSPNAACVSPGCAPGGDAPILVNCEAASADHCLHIVLRPSPGNCGAGIATGALTPYFGFFSDDVCGGDVSGGGWHHLVFVFDGTNKFIYQDDKLVSGPNSGTAAKYKGAASTTYIGGVAIGAPAESGQMLRGYLGSVRVYNRTLTQGTAAAHADGQWFAIGGDSKFDGNLSGRYCDGGVVATPQINWGWGFGADRNIIPTQAGKDSTVPFLFTEEDTNEFIGQGTISVNDRQSTMTTPPTQQANTAAFTQSQLSFVTPAWFCDPAANPNVAYTYGLGNCGATNCATTTPSDVLPSVHTRTYTPTGLATNTRYDTYVKATYTDVAPGNTQVVGPSNASPTVFDATYACPPATPPLPTTTGKTAVSLVNNCTPAFGDGLTSAAGSCPAAVTPNPCYTAFDVEGSNDNGANYIQVSGYLAQNGSFSNPRAIVGLAKSSKYIFRTRNENLDGVTTSPSGTTAGNVTQPQTPGGFGGTSAQGTPGITCPKTQIKWTWNAVPIGSNQLPSPAATVPEYLLTDPGANPISPGSFPNCAGCQTTTQFIEGVDAPSSPLTPGTMYTRKLYSFDSGAPSSPDIRFSDPTILGSAITATAPNLAPTSLAFQSLVGGVLWSWNAPPNLCSPQEYDIIDQHTGALASPSPQGNPIFNAASVVTWQQSPLGANQQVSVAVKAFDTVGGFGPLSLSATGYSQAFPPINLSFSGVSTGAVVLNWSGNGNPTYTRYEISESPDNFTVVISTPYKVADNLTANTAPIYGLLSGTTYYFRVRAINGQAADGSGTVFTSFISGSLQTLFSPPAVTGAALSNSSIDWQWPSVSNVSAYQVFRTPPGGLQTTLLPPYAGILHYTPGGLSVNTQYGAQVLALNAQGLPSPSPVVNVYTLANPPTVPANDIVGVTSNTITYQWNANGNPVGTFYEIDVATNALFNGVVSTNTPSATQITVSGLFPLTTYFAQLRSFNGDLIPVNPYVIMDSTRTNGDALVSQSSAPPTVYQIAAGAVGQWHFDESTGTASADVSGYNNGATLTCVYNGCVSTPTWTSGPMGLKSAVSLTGQTSSFVLIPDAPQYHFTTSLTLEAWVNPATLAEVNGAGLVAKGPFNGEDFFMDVFGGKYRFTGCPTASGGVAVSAASIVPGQWTHVAGTYNSGTGLNTIYINGTASGTGNCGARAASTGVNVSVGSRRSGTLAYDLGFNGAVDEVRIINGLYSASQVQQDYLGSFPSTVTFAGANSSLQVVVPPNAFGGPATIYASNDPLNHPLKITGPQLMLGLASEPTRQILIPGMFVEIVPIVNGLQYTGYLGSTATIILPYADANNDGLIDGVKPSIAASTLRFYTLDTSINQWVQLPSTVDLVNHRIIAQTPHFSVFGAFGTATTGNTTIETRVYPVPWKQGSGGSFDAPNLTFDTLPAEGTLRIFTLSGQKVADLSFHPSNAGKIFWNGLNFNGNPAVSGVYFGLIKSVDGSTRVVKFAIER